MPRLSVSSLVGLRSVIRPEYTGLPAEDLERVLQDSISGLPAATTEDFMSTLSSFGKAAGPALQRAAPDIISGAAQGAQYGGIYGAIGGAGVGLASSLLKDQQKPAPAASTAPARVASSPPTATTAPTVSTAPPSSPPPAATAAATAASAPGLPTGQGAAATLFSLLGNDAIKKALLSQVLASSGSQQVPTASGTSLPPGAINNLLTQLLANASEALWESESNSEQSYLQD